VAENSLEILTIGHSSQPYESFLEKLVGAGVTAIADVRTSPFSRQFPQFSRDTLRASLRADGIEYVYLGAELGGRPAAPDSYTRGIADYEKMARSEFFRRGLDRALQGAAKFKLALMCSEQDPLDCHRCLLVGRALAERGVAVRHILPDGATATQEDVEAELFKLSRLTADDLFEPRESRLAAAYRQRAIKVAYEEAAETPLAVA
jgi:uncharacterized protein (DUF488 family)